MWVWVTVVAVSVLFLGRCLLAVARAIEFRAQGDSLAQEKLAEKFDRFIEAYYGTHLQICPAGKPKAEHPGSTFCAEHDPLRRWREQSRAKTATD